MRPEKNQCGEPHRSLEGLGRLGMQLATPANMRAGLRGDAGDTDGKWNSVAPDFHLP